MGGLKDVARVLAVSSCKGGVGKSTVAINLAHALSGAGHRVGVFDADIYGPSLPTLIGVEAPKVVKRSDGMITAVEHSGLTCMSYGFVAKRKSSGERVGAFLRGPMASRYVTQLLETTVWGALDYLVVDLPPGTGDILLTLGQNVRFNGSVMVTTPQRLSFVDVIKGLDLFAELKIPPVAVVENMAYFTCDHGTRYNLFGPSHTQTLSETYGIPCTYEVPVDARVATGSDRGRPIVVEDPSHSISKVFAQLAGDVHKELNRIESPAESSTITAQWSERKKALAVRCIDHSGAKELYIPAATLRARCRCALCVDELTGQSTPVLTSFHPDVFPVSVEPKGNYAVAVVWSDGHTGSIYALQALKALGEGLE